MKQTNAQRADVFPCEAAIVNLAHCAGL